MKFISRDQEYAIRLALAVIIILVWVGYKDDITHLFPNKVLRGIILALSIMVIGWLNWGKLITPRKQKN